MMPPTVMNSQVPSPLPPWLRPVQSPMVQTIYGVDTIDLSPDVTYLAQQNPSNGNNDPYRVTLPAGNYVRQYKQILIPGNIAPNSAPFLVIGPLVNANSLVFDGTHTSALLTWDGYAWHLIGGSALKSTET